MRISPQAGWLFTTIVTLAFAAFVWSEYRPAQVGYSEQTRARMDDLVANLTPLSVADIGLDAEEFMDDVQQR